MGDIFMPVDEKTQVRRSILYSRILREWKFELDSIILDLGPKVICISWLYLS